MKDYDIIDMYEQFKAQLIKQAAEYCLETCEIDAEEVEVDDIQQSAFSTFMKMVNVINSMDKEFTEYIRNSQKN